MKKKNTYLRRQKLIGLGLIVLGVLSAIILDGDVTAALLVTPIGAYVLFTKDQVIWDDDYPEIDEFEEDEES